MKQALNPFALVTNRIQRLWLAAVVAACALPGVAFSQANPSPVNAKGRMQEPTQTAPLSDAEAADIVQMMDSLLISYDREVRLATRQRIESNANRYSFHPDSTPRYTPEQVAQRLRELPSVVPLDYNSTVQKFIDAYTVRLRGLVSKLVGQKEIYFPIIEEVFEREGIPLELKYLCVIESAFNNRARSRAAAVGLWQFMYGTAKMYNLRIDSYIDERMDPYKSTVAAAKYLKHLYSIYRDWHLVIAAYNCGPGRINRAIRMAGGKTNYWEIIQLLPRETRGYVPSYIAATYALNYYAEHNIKPQWFDFGFDDSVKVSGKEIKLEQIAAITQTDVQVLRDMNPALRLDVVPYSSKAFTLRVPRKVADFFAQYPDSIYRVGASPQQQLSSSQLSELALVGRRYDSVPENSRLVKHVVRRGQTFAIIAKAYKVDVNALMAWNNARDTNLEVGQTLKLYLPQRQNLSSAAATATRSAAQAPASGYQNYRVQPGDTLWDIARKHNNVTVEAIRRANGMTASSAIRPGQMLRIPVN